MKIFWLVFCLLPMLSFGQNSELSVSSKKCRLDAKHPSAYISFDKFGSREPLYYSNESNDGVWLRFRNNSLWRITIRTFGVKKEYGDVGVFYEIKSLSKESAPEKENTIPIGYREKHVSSTYSLEPGSSFLFSVPREHLDEGLYLLVPFSYEWEQDGDSGGGGNIFHLATFFSSSLPKQTN
ncbi:MAG: hypothetical protein ACK5NT_10670 [Pyrinomonadaceae bacterium]